MLTHMVTVGHMEDLSHHNSDVVELGTILQRLAALGDREWLEDILVLARKRLRTLEEARRETETQ